MVLGVTVWSVVCLSFETHFLAPEVSKPLAARTPSQSNFQCHPEALAERLHLSNLVHGSIVAITKANGCYVFRATYPKEKQASSAL